MDLTIDKDETSSTYGFGVQESTDFNKLANIANGSPRQSYVRYVYKFNKLLEEILKELKEEGLWESGPFKADDFYFQAWFEDKNDLLIKNTDAIGFFQIQDLNGDGKVDSI